MVEETVKVKLNKNDLESSIIILEKILVPHISKMTAADENFLFIKSRKKELVTARYIFFYCVETYLGLGSQFKMSLRYDMDHSTLSHGKSQIEDNLSLYKKQWMPKIDYLFDIINNSVDTEFIITPQDYANKQEIKETISSYTRMVVSKVVKVPVIKYDGSLSLAVAISDNCNITYVKKGLDGSHSLHGYNGKHRLANKGDFFVMFNRGRYTHLTPSEYKERGL
jgi:hypothetical protein